MKLDTLKPHFTPNKTVTLSNFLGYVAEEVSIDVQKGLRHIIYCDKERHPADQRPLSMQF